MQNPEYAAKSTRFDIGRYVQSISQSPGYQDILKATYGYLRALFLTEEEIEALNVEQRLRPLPMRLVTDLAVRAISFEFKDKYGVNITELDLTQVAKEIEDLMYNRVQTGKRTPMQNEFISRLAGQLKELFADIETRTRQLPTETYSQPQKEQSHAGKPQYQTPTLQSQMDKLLEDFK